MRNFVLTILFILTYWLAAGQGVRPDQFPEDYTPTMTDAYYTQEGATPRKIYNSSLDSLFAAGVTEVTNVSDTSGISSPQRGDVAINSGGDTLLIHGVYGWLVFVGGGGAGHDAVTLSGTGTYLTLSTQDIQVDPITESDISDLDHIAVPSVSTVTLSNSSLDTVDFNSSEFGIFHIETTSVSSDTLYFANAVNGGSYTLDLDNVTTDTLTWPANLLDANEDTLGTRIYTDGKFISFYYDGTDYFAAQALGSELVDTTADETFIAQYQTLLDTATARGYSLPTSATQTAGNTLMTALVNNGILDSLELFYVFETDGDSLFALLNWVDPSTFEASITGVDLDFTSLTGFIREIGDTSYIDTGWDIRDSTIISLNDASHGGWVTDFTLSSQGNIAGAYDTSLGKIQWFWCTTCSPNQFKSRAYDTGISPNAASGPTSGFFHFSNSGVGGHRHKDYKDGSNINSGTSSSEGANALDIFILDINLNGSRQTGNSFDATMKIYFVGTGLRSQVSNLYNAVNTYLSAI